MAEYIERDAILESIVKKHGTRNDIEEQTALDIWDGIKKIPTADVVEVVFCKDCKHYTNIDTYRNPPRLDFHWCNKLGNVTKENDYCSYGERRCENDSQRSGTSSCNT